VFRKKASNSRQGVIFIPAAHAAAACAPLIWKELAMNIAYRCEHCGTMLGAADLHDKSACDSSWRAKCPGCGKKITIPKLLAELPTPQLGLQGAGAVGARTVIAGGEAGHGGASSSAVGKVASLMPWTISLFFHMGIFLVMLFFILMNQMHRQILEISAPAAAYNEDPGGAANPGTIGPGIDPNQASGKKEFSRNVNAGSIIDSARTDKQVSIFGRGAVGGGEDPGFGHGGSGGGGGRTHFLKPEIGTAAGNCHSIVYVIDRSGSMIDSFDYLKNAMADTISRLSDLVEFDIILFSDGHPSFIEMGSKSLVPATANYKEAAGEFLSEQNVKGSTLAADGIRRAFDVLGKAGDRSGKLMILLTDGAFNDSDNVLQVFKERNADKKVLVNTYLYAPSEEKAGRDIMMKIAKENGGNYKFFDTRETK
jgi:hypothetical protein